VSHTVPETTAPQPAAPQEDTMTEILARPLAGPEVHVAPPGPVEPILRLENLDVHYGDYHAVRKVSMDVPAHQITALIGPSGCGKSTVLRCLNRTNDLVPGARVSGSVTYHGIDLYGPDVDPIEVRRRVGMVFQKPNPFPKSIYDNVAYGPRVTGMKLRRSALDELVEHALSRAALWGEVKDKLDQSGFSLSGGQQQRLCIARAIAVNPEILLMDEPCASLDPIATALIEDLMQELVTAYTVVIVTHNMQQAARVSHQTAFFTATVGDDGQRYGQLVEIGATAKMFTTPADRRTEDYISGRFG
jgi:phosphate transport system ATP-binding protein